MSARGGSKYVTDRQEFLLMEKLRHHWFEPPRIKTAVSYMLDKYQNVPAGQLGDVQKKT
jgi:hypothetical protein